MRCLLDTNVVSELRRSHPHPAVLDWFAGVSGADLYLSTLTIGEIHQGIARLRRRDPTQTTVLADWLAQLEGTYTDRIWPVTAAVARRWAELNAERSLPVVDSLLGATALVHDAVLVSRNVRDLAGTDVALLDPFAPQS